ncbi:unnamed protein product [Prunus armeniaca]
MDCLLKVLVKVGMESLLLDVPFVCKSWYKATLNPSCWQSLLFPDNECIEFWPWDAFECPNFQNLMDRFASEYQIDGDRCSITTFLKFVINRSSGNATVLKLPKCCTIEAFEFAANVIFAVVECVQVSWPRDFEFTRRCIGQQPHELELIGKWRNLEGSEFPEFLRGMDNFVLPIDGYAFHLHVDETWDEMLNDLGDEE